ncbi:hypothetical protein [Candidatus Neptunochlamydia vexilliferae]|uniref:Uncharacterized protein n=1 Tax=Candidatus Neptunichlamydia vexilliferae TaxID=1651774 RepID=A0ABS0B0W0_9BACT|nr:hypothetical protein [Candidatus Neptunochlamydia vexilliferae]MBF5060032.1 hypothetical protein [Candidatus Neptunochlamydia vexilliferae]
MNLLPFVMIIILVLSLFSTTQYQKMVSQKKDKKIYSAYFKGLREARNEKVRHTYNRSLDRKPGTSTGTKNNANKQIQDRYFRNDRIGWENGKLNLSSLLNDPEKWPQLEAIAAAYVKRLYIGAKFYPKGSGLEKKLIKALVAKYKKEEDPPPFHTITFEDRELNWVFYKMVKGTHTYTLEGRGHPPFADFFTFEEMEGPPIHFHYANPLLLKVVLGEGKAQQLISEEKKLLINARVKCRSPLKKERVEEFLGIRRVLFETRYKTSDKVSGKHTDPNTQITVMAK